MPHRKFPGHQRGHARHMRSNVTDAERKLWYRLRAHRFYGFGFRRQVLIGQYIADFLCHEARLVIELDGSQHGQNRQMHEDQQRSGWLEVRDYKILRFWNNEVLNNLGGVLDQIETALRAIPPSRPGTKRRTDLPLKRGGELEQHT